MQTDTRSLADITLVDIIYNRVLVLATMLGQLTGQTEEHFAI